MSAKPAIMDIAVTAMSDLTCYISWRTRDARYHFHLYDDATEYTNQTLYKNSIANHGQPGYHDSRKLDGSAASNAYMIACAMDTVKRGDMITVARAAYHLEQTRLRNEEQAFAKRRERAKEIFASMKLILSGEALSYTLTRFDMEALLSYASNETE